MIISYGFLSLLQLTILPGLIITRLSKLRGFWANLLIAIGLSPLVNYAFVLLTALFGLYTRTITIAFVSVEAVLLFVLLIPVIRRQSFRLPVKQAVGSFFKDYFCCSNDPDRWIKDFLKFLILTSAAGMLIYYFVIYGTQYNSVFTTWDAVVSWNRWAMEWITNQAPIYTGHYPQLIPTNLSVTYQLMGDIRVQFFAKAYMCYIEIFILFSIFYLAVKERKSGLFLAVILTGLLQHALGSQGSGYVDTPVSFWALMAFICLMLMKLEPQTKQYLFFGAIFAATAAIVKQAGLWMAALYPVFIFLAIRDGLRLDIKRLFFKVIGTEFLIVAPWYLYFEYQLLSKRESSEIPYLLDLTTKGKSFWEIISNGFNNVANNLTNQYWLSIIFIFVLVILMFFANHEKTCRRVNFIITLPFFIVWTFAFSYDHRNINLIVPFVGITSGIGFARVLDYFASMISLLWKKIYSIQPVHRAINSAVSFFRSLHQLYSILPLILLFAATATILFIALPYRYSDDYLISKSIAKQKLMGDNHLNQLLYEYKDAHGFDAKILTDYQYLNFLPEMEGLYVYAYPNNDFFLQQMDNPEIGYVLVNVTIESDQIKAKIDSLLESGKISTLIDFGYYQMYSTCRGVCE